MAIDNVKVIDNINNVYGHNFYSTLIQINITKLSGLSIWTSE